MYISVEQSIWTAQHDSLSRIFAAQLEILPIQRFSPLLDDEVPAAFAEEEVASLFLEGSPALPCIQARKEPFDLVLVFILEHFLPSRMEIR